jgi:hypothetical protein
MCAAQETDSKREFESLKDADLRVNRITLPNVQVSPETAGSG